MTEASYTAWDDKQYVWPPPDGWYQAPDQKWWPEGYGPQPAEPAADEAVSEITETTAETVAPNDLVDQISEADFGSNLDTVGEAAQSSVLSGDGAGLGTSVGGAFDSALDTATEAPGAIGGAIGGFSDQASDLKDGASDFGDTASSFGDSSAGLGDTATGLGDTASGLTDGLGGTASGLTDGLGDAAAGLGDTASSFGDSAAGLGDTASGLGDKASGLGGSALGLGGGLGEKASGLTDAASDLGDQASGLGDRVSGFASEAPGVDELMPDSVEDGLGISDVDGMPTSDIGELGGLDGLTERVSDFGEVPTPDLGDLPAPGLNDLPTPSLDDLPTPGLDDLNLDPTQVVDDIPSIQDLASPDLNLSSLPSSPGVDGDMTQVVPTNIGGQFSDPLPPPPGSGPTLDASAPGLDDLPAPDVGLPTFDAGSIDPPSFDAPQVDVPEFDLPTFDPAGVEPPTFDSPTIAAPQVGRIVRCAVFESGRCWNRSAWPESGDGRCSATRTIATGESTSATAVRYPWIRSGRCSSGWPPTGHLGIEQEQRRGKTLLFVVLGVLALAAIGALLYWQFGRDSGDGDSAAAATGPGSVSQPHPRTTGVVVFYPDGDTDQRWVIEVLDPVSTGAGDLAAGSEDGDVFAVTRVRVRNESGSDGASIGDLRFNAVNGTGDLIIRQDNQCPATADDLDYNAAVAVGGEAIGAVCWEVPASDLDGLKLGLESEKVAGRVHIALQ